MTNTPRRLAIRHALQIGIGDPPKQRGTSNPRWTLSFRPRIIFHREPHMRATCLPLTLALMLVSATAVAAADSGSPPNTARLWRTSELAGVPILDPSHIPIGKVTDVLFDRTGRAKYVVIGVGGVFGLGEKNVAIPFDQVRFTNREIVAPANPVTTSSTGAPAGTPGASPAGGFAEATAVPDQQAGDQIPRSVGHPDHGMVDLTADQIQKAPTFHFPS